MHKSHNIKHCSAVSIWKKESLNEDQYPSNYDILSDTGFEFYNQGKYEPLKFC